MKIQTLNIWGGRLHDELIKHLLIQAQTVDIFCFQEVYDSPTQRIFTRDPHELSGESMWESKYRPRANNLREMQELLPDFQPLYYSAQENYDYHGPVDYPLFYGICMMVRKGITILHEGEVFVFRQRNSVEGKDNTTLARNLQYIQFVHNGTVLTVANLHGLWNGKGKKDTHDRIEQSKKTRAFLDSQKGLKILCGDLNLLPETESLGILEQGMVNLVKRYNIQSTRSRYYTKPEKFADYILVSPDVEVVDFQVLQNEVSDHLPLVVEIT